MRYRNLKKFTNKNKTEGLVFFAQRSEELLFDYSLDSYKPSALHAPSLCSEAISTIKDINKGAIGKHNIEHILEELSHSISHDPVAKSLLDLPASKYILDPKKFNFDVLQNKLEILGRSLDPFRYFEKCSDLLLDAIISNKKISIDTLTKLFYTSLINIGVHKTHLYEKVVKFFYQKKESQEISCNRDFEKYKESIFPYSHTFTIYFTVSNLINDISKSLGKFKCKILNKLPEELHTLAKDNQFKRTENELYIQVSDITSLDYYTAREKAEQHLSQLRDLFTLFHHKTQITWSDRSIVSQCCEDQPRIVCLPKNSMEKGEDLKPERASQLLNHMLKSFQMRGSDFSKFNRAVDFHGLSVNNSDPESQLLGLWIAIETIVPTNTQRTKINQIVDGITPFIYMNYIGRLVRTLAGDMYRWHKYKSRQIIKEVSSSPNLSRAYKLLLLLSMPEHQNLRKKLYECCDDFHLIRYRAYCLSKHFSTPEKTLEMLNLHKQKVEWQLRRIYRTRNQIVHSGNTPSNIHTLIENGHDFLDQVILTITRMSASSYRIKTIQQAFELAGIAQTKIINHLSNVSAHDPTKLGILINEHEFIEIPKTNN